jgi:hypothetical protein
MCCLLPASAPSVAEPASSEGDTSCDNAPYRVQWSLRPSGISRVNWAKTTKHRQERYPRRRVQPFAEESAEEREGSEDRSPQVAPKQPGDPHAAGAVVPSLNQSRGSTGRPVPSSEKCHARLGEPLAGKILQFLASRDGMVNYWSVRIGRSGDARCPQRNRPYKQAFLDTLQLGSRSPDRDQ